MSSGVGRRQMPALLRSARWPPWTSMLWRPLCSQNMRYFSAVEAGVRKILREISSWQHKSCKSVKAYVQVRLTDFAANKRKQIEQMLKKKSCLSYFLRLFLFFSVMKDLCSSEWHTSTSWKQRWCMQDRIISWRLMNFAQNKNWCFPITCLKIRTQSK